VAAPRLPCGPMSATNRTPAMMQTAATKTRGHLPSAFHISHQAP
jgi:hypothetical protein